MEPAGKVIVVTGGGSGIGEALCRRFAAEGAKAVVVADLDGDKAVAVADEIGGLAVATDVTVEADVRRLVERTEEAYGPVDLFCANAGVGGGGGIDQPDEAWDLVWRANVLSHVYAARAVVPAMADRGEGYFLSTASAAGLLLNLGNAPYTVTKHAAVAFAEWLAVTYGDRGVRVSCLCPMGVRTPMLTGGLDVGDSAARSVAAAGRVLEPAEAAEAVVQGLREERFLILPHPEVAEMYRRKGDDPDRWLAGMRRLQAALLGGS
ncbi:MAG TPA: SDR family oxidoreductase [Acidimicrobiales bacterium]|nr:SDR family oxidoreductase [Acidimicrobiales bacterium]